MKLRILILSLLVALINQRTLESSRITKSSYRVFFV